jgi:O-antigen/teichoic acid export membrane protein
MLMKANYYLSSFFWSTVSKILNAILGFVSIPIFLDVFGKAEYGIISIAMACNAYMYVLDLGMNVGAVKYYSQWKSEGKFELIERVTRTNITFYLLISIINIFLLFGLFKSGEYIFSVSYDLVPLLNSCFLILAGFCVLNWLGAVFYQLLVANELLSYAMKVQCLQVGLKFLLLFVIVRCHISVITYFFLYSLIVALPVFPYAYKCMANSYLRSIVPAFYFSDFKKVLFYSISIFALTILQVTAVQSRPIVISMFAENGELMVADFRVVELIPSFLIVLCGMFSSIFLPKTSSLVAKNDTKELCSFASKWTLRTSILTNFVCVPFILCASDVIYAYIGSGYEYLSVWLSIWCMTVILQIHTTPGNAIILAYGRTKPLIVITFLACFISIVLNISLLGQFGVGAAIISYLVYVIIIVSQYYFYYYKRVVHLPSMRMLKGFVFPTLLAFSIMFLCLLSEKVVPEIFTYSNRHEAIISCILKVGVWFVMYAMALQFTGIVNIKDVIGYFPFEKKNRL